ncbi:MAG: hypothetical protein EAZ12_02315 [Sphingobacteriia bacterium]|nr:MAG: hypothetical protein EAZ12_02315 [Sphingobacteriia bacterium]
MKSIYTIFFCSILFACQNTNSANEIKGNDSVVTKVDTAVQLNNAMPIDTIEDRELDPWDEYTMTKKDSIVFKQLAGYYFVPRAASINLKFNASDGTCQFHDLDEKLQYTIYQVKNDQILLFSTNDTKKYVLKFQPSPAPNDPKELRLIMGDYQFVKGEEPKSN